MTFLRCFKGLSLLTAVPAVTALPAAALADTVASPGCALVAPPGPRTFAVTLAGGARASVLDRYGGAFQRNRLFVQWTVRISRFSGPAPLTAAEFVVDGRVMHTDDTVRMRKPHQATLEWATPSRRFAAGEHKLIIRLRTRPTNPTARPPVREIEIPFEATDCPFAAFSGEALRKPRALGVISWASAIEGPGPDLASVAATLRWGASFGAPRARPGAGVGEVAVANTTYPLRAPRSGGVLLRSGLLTVTLDVAHRRVAVTGLPDGTTVVTLRLRAGILRTAGCSRATFAGELRSAAGDRVEMAARDVRRC